MLVREKLHLDMSWMLEVALEEDRLVSEACFRLATCGPECLVELVCGANHTHPAPASARCGLDEEREPDLLGRAGGEHGDTGLRGQPLCLQLVTGRPEDLVWRPHPGEPGALHGGGEVRALGQEAVARMDGVGPTLACGTEMLSGVEVAFDLQHFAAPARVEGAGVIGSCDRHCGDAEPVARSKDARGDLAPVRD